MALGPQQVLDHGVPREWTAAQRRGSQGHELTALRCPARGLAGASSLCYQPGLRPLCRGPRPSPCEVCTFQDEKLNPGKTSSLGSPLVTRNSAPSPGSVLGARPRFKTNLEKAFGGRPGRQDSHYPSVPRGRPVDPSSHAGDSTERGKQGSGWAWAESGRPSQLSPQRDHKPP